MAADIQLYVKSCELCQKRNPKTKKDALQQSQVLEIPSEVVEPFNWLVMDQIELPSIRSSGYQYLLLIMDVTSKWMFS